MTPKPLWGSYPIVRRLLTPVKTIRPCGPLFGRASAGSCEAGDNRPLYYSAGLAGRSGNWVDGTAFRWTGADVQDENRHLAKVRVAGSNPVFRSKKDQFRNPFSGLRTQWGVRRRDGQRGRSVAPEMQLQWLQKRSHNGSRNGATRIDSTPWSIPSRSPSPWIPLK